MKKGNAVIQECIFILIMVLYPFVGVNQGLSVVDTTYSLSNFAFFTQMKGTWAVATYLANALGWLFMKLPMGSTMLGINCYTRLVIVLMAILAYKCLKDTFSPILVFLTQVVAIGLCWAPTTVLYHYLTYLFLHLGTLLLYSAFKGNIARQKKCFVLAGVCLGMGVAARMPNVTHTAMILAVWYGTWLYAEDKQKAVLESVKNTGFCLLGYVIGLLVTLGPLSLRFGIKAYPEMVQNLFAMTEKATDYKPTSMITGMFGEYLDGLKWFLPLVVIAVLFAVALCYLTRRSEKGAGGKLELIVKILLPIILLVLVRLYWGRGMFDLRYYNYGAVYGWTVQWLLLTICTMIYVLISKGMKKEWKLLASMVLLQILIVPLGGNNVVYPLMNDMFFILPVSAGLLWELVKGDGESIMQRLKTISNRSFAPAMTVALLFAILFVQSVGFHGSFALQDGVWGEGRDTLTDNNEKTKGIYTTKQNGEMLDDLFLFAEDAGLAGQPVILYGELPGLGYFLDMPSALTTFWPDLDSYRMAEYTRDLEQVEKQITEEKKAPVVITSSGIAAFLDDDAEGMQWFGVDQDAMRADEKLDILAQYLRSNSYEQTFCNGAYAVYELINY